MEMSLEEITPHRAADLLAKQAPNRRIKLGKVHEWAADMKAGLWQPIPQPIMLNPDGQLIDGQNRLSAVVQSGCTVEMWVARDVPQELRRYIDGGTSRTAADVLSMEHGARNSRNLQAIANLVLRYERHRDTVWSSRDTIGKQRVIDEYLADPEVYQDAFAAGQSASKNTGSGLWLTRASYSALRVLVERHSPTSDLWDGWHQGVSSGADLSYGDPRLTLRSARSSFVGTRGQYSLLACIKTWNAYVSGAELKMLKVGSPKYLPMPKIA